MHCRVLSEETLPRDWDIPYDIRPYRAVGTYRSTCRPKCASRWWEQAASCWDWSSHRYEFLFGDAFRHLRSFTSVQNFCLLDSCPPLCLCIFSSPDSTGFPCCMRSGSIMTETWPTKASASQHHLAQCITNSVCFLGGRRSEFLRRAEAWRLFAEFFPIKLVQTAPLSPEKNYIFGCHPHGILCFSHFVNFATEGTNFSQIFPGLRPHLIALNYQFWLPFHREIFILSGKHPVIIQRDG